MATKALSFQISAVDRTKQAFASVQRSLGGVTKKLGKMKLGIAAVTAAFGVLGKKAFGAADKIAKTADAVDLTTDALQEYQHAAGLVDVTQEQLQSGFSAFAKRLGELRQGTGALNTFLEKLDANFAANVRSAGSTDEALNLLFQRLGETADQSDRAALAAAAFGRTAGIGMTRLVKDGTEALAAMRQEARDLGLVLEEDLLRDIERANDAMTRLGSVMSAEFSRLVGELAPSIEWLSSVITDVLVGSVEKLSNAWRIVRVVALHSIEGLVGAVRTLFDVLMLLPEAFRPDIVEDWRDQLRGVESTLEDMRRSIDIFPSAVGSASEAMDRLGRSLERTGAAAGTTAGELDEVGKAMARMQKEAAGRVAERAVERRIEKERSVIPAVDEVTKASEAAADRTAQAWGDATLSMGRSITGFVQQGKFDLLNFADFVLQAIGQVLPLLFPQPGRGGGGGDGGILGGLFGFQHGGRFKVGGSGGPDSQVVAFRASPGEEVSVAPPGMAAGGGVTIVNKIDARGAAPGVEEDIRRVLREERPGLIAQAVNASAAEVRRRADLGGPYALGLTQRV